MADPLIIPTPGPVPPTGGNPPEVIMAVPESQQYEPGNLQLSLTALGNEFGAAAASRVRRMDQLAADAASMWAVHLTTPTVFAGMGYQAAAGHMPPRQTEVGVAPAAAPNAAKA